MDKNPCARRGDVGVLGADFGAQKRNCTQQPRITVGFRLPDRPNYLTSTVHALAPALRGAREWVGGHVTAFLVETRRAYGGIDCGRSRDALHE